MRRIFFLFLLVLLIAFPALAFFGGPRFGAQPFGVAEFGSEPFGEDQEIASPESGSVRITTSGDTRVTTGGDTRVIP